MYNYGVQCVRTPYKDLGTLVRCMYVVHVWAYVLIWFLGIYICILEKRIWFLSALCYNVSKQEKYMMLILNEIYNMRVPFRHTI